MRARGVFLTAAFTAVAAGIAWLLFAAIPEWYGPRPHATMAQAPVVAKPAVPGKKNGPTWTPLVVASAPTL